MTRKKVLLKAAVVFIGLVVAAGGYLHGSSVTHVKSLGHTAIVQPPKSYTQRTARGTTTYTAELTFTLESGRVVTMKRSLPEEVFNDFESKTPVRVFYDPADPGTFVFDREQPSTWVPVGIGVAIALVGLLFP